MKHLILTLFVLSFCVASCGDDDTKKSKCLKCTSNDPDVTVTGGEACEGDKDPDSGETITLSDLQTAKALFEGFGAECTLK